VFRTTLGVSLFIGFTVHNFTEGVATANAAANDALVASSS
jgi:zinc transporter ZupT